MVSGNFIYYLGNAQPLAELNGTMAGPVIYEQRPLFPSQPSRLLLVSPGYAETVDNPP